MNALKPTSSIHLLDKDTKTMLSITSERRKNQNSGLIESYVSIGNKEFWLKKLGHHQSAMSMNLAEENYTVW